MQFTWVDYPNIYEAELETWCDETVRHAIDGDSIKEEHDWYLENNYVFNKDYFCKIVLEDKTAVALVMSGTRINKSETETVICIDTFIINPELRNQGYGTKIIAEIIQNSENIIVAQIHKDNETSKKLFKKSGFHFICTEAEINDDWFDWIYPASAADRYLAWRE